MRYDKTSCTSRYNVLAWVLQRGMKAAVAKQIKNHGTVYMLCWHHVRPYALRIIFGDLNNLRSIVVWEMGVSILDE